MPGEGPSWGAQPPCCPALVYPPPSRYGWCVCVCWDRFWRPSSIEKVMHFGIDFWKDFGGFLVEKSRHVGTKIEQKSIRRGSGGLLAAKPENERCRVRFLGPSWGRLGALLGAALALGSPSWGDFGRLGPSKNRFKNRSIFECLLGSDF